MKYYYRTFKDNEIIVEINVYSNMNYPNCHKQEPSPQMNTTDNLNPMKTVIQPHKIYNPLA